jgi:hypothetical protein
LINGYISQLEKLNPLQFVTLTVPNCNADDLKETISSLLKSFSNIIRVIRERKKIKISGIRKIEITYNYFLNNYHPHIHVLVDGGVGDLIVTEWLKRYDNASIKAQDVRNADKNSIKEIFKYSTKMITNGSVYIPAIDNIMISLQGRRCFQPFGNIKKIDEDVSGIESIEYDEIEEYPLIETFKWKECDWVNGNKTLTGYVPPEKEISFIE